MKTCAACGEPFKRHRKYSRAQWERAEFCSNVCRGASIQKERPLCACGCGQRVSQPRFRYLGGHARRPVKGEPYFNASIGRWCATGRDGRRFVWARLVMEAKVGRGLERQEVVHHIDGDRTNDDPDNLMLFASHGEHMRHHHEAGDLHRLTDEDRRWRQRRMAELEQLADEILARAS